MHRQTTWRTSLRSWAATGLIAGVTGVGVSTGAAAESNVINGCYQKQNGQLRILTAGHQCLPSEVAISWNIEGPPGPPGAPGAPGVSGLERVEFSSPANSDSPKSAFAKCPTGKRVVGGGAQSFIEGATAGPIAIRKSFASESLDGWAATAEEMVPTDETWFVTAYALCATVVP